MFHPISQQNSDVDIELNPKGGGMTPKENQIEFRNQEQVTKDRSLASSYRMDQGKSSTTEV